MKLVHPAPVWADIPNVDVVFHPESHQALFVWEPGVDVPTRNEVLNAAWGEIEMAIARGVHVSEDGAEALVDIIRQTMRRWKDRWVRDSNSLKWELLQ